MKGKLDSEAVRKDINFDNPYPTNQQACCWKDSDFSQGRRERVPTLVFWPGEFHGLYSPWSHKELDTTERPSLSLSSVPVAQVQWGCKVDGHASVCYLFFWSISELCGW